VPANCGCLRPTDLYASFLTAGLSSFYPASTSFRRYPAPDSTPPTLRVFTQVVGGSVVCRLSDSAGCYWPATHASGDDFRATKRAGNPQVHLQFRSTVRKPSIFACREIVLRKIDAAQERSKRGAVSAVHHSLANSTGGDSAGGEPATAGGPQDCDERNAT
jgi:hypothetical protein